MNVIVTTPAVEQLDHVRRALERWQHDDGPLHLHPGDLGWYTLRGSAATAAAVRVWSQGDDILAIALLDGAELLRFALAPDRRQDERLALQIAADVADPGAGVLGQGSAVVEARGAEALSERLAKNGWLPDEPWTPLHRDLTSPVEASAVRVETLEPDETDEWASVHWSAFRGTPLPEDRRRAIVDGWRAVAESPFSSSARILCAYDEDTAVAVAAVWSAGAGRPGLIEPMGVHQEHRGRGYGVAITRAAASTLRSMGSSSAVVCAETANLGAVATYLGAGFSARADVRDWRRDALDPAPIGP